jgi:hypothetical protein
MEDRARAAVRLPFVQPLEDHEDALEVFGRDADAVVGDAEGPVAGRACGSATAQLTDFTRAAKAAPRIAQGGVRPP